MSFFLVLTGKESTVGWSSCDWFETSLDGISGILKDISHAYWTRRDDTQQTVLRGSQELQPSYAVRNLFFFSLSLSPDANAYTSRRKVATMRGEILTSEWPDLLFFVHGLQRIKHSVSHDSARYQHTILVYPTSVRKHEEKTITKSE